MKNIYKSDLITDISNLLGYHEHDIKLVVDNIFYYLKQAMINGDTITISGFGNFSLKNFKARDYIHPKTRKKIHKHATSIPKFYPCKSFRDRCKGD